MQALRRQALAKLRSFRPRGEGPKGGFFGEGQHEAGKRRVGLPAWVQAPGAPPAGPPGEIGANELGWEAPWRRRSGAGCAAHTACLRAGAVQRGRGCWARAGVAAICQPWGVPTRGPHAARPLYVHRRGLHLWRDAAAAGAEPQVGELGGALVSGAASREGLARALPVPAGAAARSAPQLAAHLCFRWDLEGGRRPATRPLPLPLTCPPCPCSAPPRPRPCSQLLHAGRCGRHAFRRPERAAGQQHLELGGQEGGGAARRRVRAPADGSRPWGLGTGARQRAGRG